MAAKTFTLTFPREVTPTEEKYLVGHLKSLKAALLQKKEARDFVMTLDKESPSVYLFSYSAGGMEQFKVKNHAWLDRVPGLRAARAAVHEQGEAVTEFTLELPIRRFLEATFKVMGFAPEDVKIAPKG